MRVRLVRSDNDLVLNVPAAAFQELGVLEDADADLAIEDGRLIVTPMPIRPVYTFDALLAGITSDNLHEDYFDAWSLGTEC